MRRGAGAKELAQTIEDVWTARRDRYSEERGEISLAVRGQLYRRLSPEDLSTRLRAAMLKGRWTPGEPEPATSEGKTSEGKA